MEVVSTTIKPYQDTRSSLTLEGTYSTYRSPWRVRLVIETESGQQSLPLDFDAMRALHAAMGAIIAAEVERAAYDART